MIIKIFEEFSNLENPYIEVPGIESLFTIGRI